MTEHNNLQVRHATADELTNWDELVTRNPTHGDFVHTSAYAHTKAQVGWRPRHLVWHNGDRVVSVSLVLERSIPLLGRYWYLPHGPSVEQPAAVTEHVTALRKYVRTHEAQVFAVTVDPLVHNTPENREELAGPNGSLTALGALWRPGIQGNTATAIVPLISPDTELLASFHKRSRNMISRALRDGVTVQEYPATPETFAHMHRLMRLVGGGGATQLRLRSETYAETFWREFSTNGDGRFYGIDVNGSPALLAFVIRSGSRAYYKDGGSERPRTSPGMSNLLQYEMMRAMRAAGATSYDMMGVPPQDRLDDPTAPNHTLATFKLSFAREVTEYIGGFDLVLKPRRYRLWQRLGLPITQRMHRRRYNDLDMY